MMARGGGVSRTSVKDVFSYFYMYIIDIVSKHS